eukprot:354731-Chlamydomonas_euryale.AAC.2
MSAACPHHRRQVLMRPCDACLHMCCAAEEERTWADTTEEEAELKLEIAELLWDDLLTEAAEELQMIDRRCIRRTASLCADDL